MGALNAQRLAAARERFREMPRGGDADPPFLWGTHYSTPGYCLHFLVRSMPEHMLHLQAGRFDAPDRLFYDVSATWAGVTSINADVKGAFQCMRAGRALHATWLRSVLQS